MRNGRDPAKPDGMILQELAAIRPSYETSVFLLASRCSGRWSFEEAVSSVVELARSGELILCCRPAEEVDPMTPVLPKVLKVGEATSAMARLLYGEPERAWRDGDHEHLVYGLPGGSAAQLVHRLVFDVRDRLAAEVVEERRTADARVDSP